MKKAKKIAIIVAVSMIAVGFVSIVGSLAFVRFDATKLNTMEWEDKTYAVGAGRRCNGRYRTGNGR